MGVLTPLYEKPNHVLEKQRFYQNNPNALYFRGPRQRLYIGTYSILFAGGMLATLFGVTSLVKGKSSE
ncbi:hypothetical protein D9756_000302 [Leucocoprinus leucothites]|uniref:Uncharacterized protein n=1 Tax=Leucocoprinus leucothites TaxID=201217 RepID=A0A8H5LNE6_9AGAR|nr:hypothetical protein D9756_000302 [Leucoagaricus leucothites]